MLVLQDLWLVMLWLWSSLVLMLVLQVEWSVLVLVLALVLVLLLGELVLVGGFSVPVLLHSPSLLPPPFPQSPVQHCLPSLLLPRSPQLPPLLLPPLQGSISILRPPSSTPPTCF